MRQCRLCPWKLGVDPREIPNGYSAEMHARLRGTIAEPGVPNLCGPLRIMACHASPVGGEVPCAGWLHNQMGEGSNIALRLAVREGRVSGSYEIDGPQHECFEDTLPPEG